MLSNPKFKGILYCSGLKSENLKNFDFASTSFIEIFSKSGLFEKSLTELNEFCDSIYLCIDEEFNFLSEDQYKLIEQFNVNVLIKSNFTAYSSLETVSLQIKDEDVIIFHQLGKTYNLDCLSREFFEIKKNYLDSLLVFCEDLEVGLNSLPFEFSHNLKSIWISDFFQAGFVSASGRLIRWSGVLVMSNKSFNNLLTEINNSKQPQDFFFPELKYIIPVPEEAMDLSFVMGFPVYSKEPFKLCIGKFQSVDIIKSNLFTKKEEFTRNQF